MYYDLVIFKPPITFSTQRSLKRHVGFLNYCFDTCTWLGTVQWHLWSALSTDYLSTSSWTCFFLYDPVACPNPTACAFMKNDFTWKVIEVNKCQLYTSHERNVWGPALLVKSLRNKKRTGEMNCLQRMFHSVGSQILSCSSICKCAIDYCICLNC